MLSIVIPAYNEEVLLGRTLATVQEAARAVGEPYEVVVVDDASSDRTAEIAREQGARVVAVNHRQIAATRNAGAQATQGDMLLFVDADTQITPAAVRAALTAMRQGAVGGGCAVRFDGRLPLYGKILEKTFVRLYRVLGLANGCFLFCTRSAFEASGGFDESLFGAEEVVLCRELRRHGRFVVLQETIVTSGRKLRSYSAWEIFSLLAWLALMGPKSLRRREGLDIWYGERRRDSNLRE